MQRFLLCYGFVLVFGLREVRAEELDDKYVQIYNLIQEADTRVAGEQWTEAQANYREAQRALRALQKARPDWNPQVVQFRLRYVAEKLQGIAAGAPTKPESNERTKMPAADDSTTPLNLLQDQVRQLTADRHWLQARLTEALAARAIHREYQAVCVGVMTAGGTVDAPVDRHPVDRRRMAVRSSGREAITHYRVIERFRAQAGCLDGNREILFQLRLAGKLGEFFGTQCRFKLSLAFLRGGRNDLPVGHSVSAYRTSSSARRKSGSKTSGAPDARAFRIAASAAALS